MPRRMGELRRLCVEWNSLVPLARSRGINVRPRAHFHMDRVVARQRVADLRAQVAPFFAPNVSPTANPATDTFGVELEFLSLNRMSHEQIAEEVRAAGVMCQSEHYNHTTRTHWKLTTDMSCGSEMVSPPLAG